MLRPAFEMQYSSRFVDATVADMEVMNTMQPPASLPCSRASNMYRAAARVRK